MSGFSTQWLDLREDADRRARDAGLEARLAERFATRDDLRIVDLGCGTGANARALAPHLPGGQAWRFVDHDVDLLAAAQARMAAWARADADRRPLDITYQMADLGGDLRAVVRPGDDLVTAAAFFDLVSPEWIARFAATVAEAGAAFYTVLIYDGEEIWMPAHPADAAVLAAFRQHQRRDKGFGPAAGPEAADLLIRAFADAGYQVHVAASPWRLERDPTGVKRGSEELREKAGIWSGRSDSIRSATSPDAPDRALIAALAEGTAKAARETGLVDAQTAQSWRIARQEANAAIIGHVDLLALPPG